MIVIEDWIDTTAHKCHTHWTWTLYRSLIVISDLNFFSFGCPIHLNLPDLTFSTCYNRIANRLHFWPLAAIPRAYTSGLIVNDLHTVFRWNHWQVYYPRWGGRGLEQRVRRVACIEGVKQFSTSPLVIVFLLVVSVLLFSCGRVPISVHFGGWVVMMYARLDGWLDGTCRWGGVVSIARVLVLLYYTGALHFLPSEELISSHFTTLARVIWLACQTYIGRATIIDVFFVGDTKVCLNCVFHGPGLGSEIDTLLSGDYQSRNLLTFYIEVAKNSFIDRWCPRSGLLRVINVVNLSSMCLRMQIVF